MSRPIVDIESHEMRTITRNFFGLKLLHALSDGLQLPVKILILVARGLTIPEIGAVMGVYSLVIVVLELPTGGLADSWGRRKVLITGITANLIGVGLLAFGQSFLILMIAVSFSALARALASGPLEAWYVDESEVREPDNDLTRVLGRTSSMENAGLGIGALCGGLLPVLFSGVGSSEAVVTSLSISLIAALALILLELIAVSVVVSDNEATALGHSLSSVPTQVSDGLATAFGDSTLLAILGHFALAGIALSAFEILVPLRLLETGLSQEDASSAFGVMVTAGFIGAALLAPLAGALKRRSSHPLQAGGFTAIASGVVGLLAVTPALIGVVSGYLGKRLASGPTLPLIGGVVHRRVDSAQRATLLSILSLAAMLGAGVGSFALANLADWTSTALSLGVGAVSLIAGGLLLLPFARKDIPPQSADS